MFSRQVYNDIKSLAPCYTSHSVSGCVNAGSYVDHPFCFLAKVVYMALFLLWNTNAGILKNVHAFLFEVLNKGVNNFYFIGNDNYVGVSDRRTGK